MLTNAEKQRRRRERIRKALSNLPLPSKGCIITGGERIQCHVCGYWAKALAPSHISIHNMTAEDYREEFGLNRRQPLAGTEFREWCRKHIYDLGINNKYGSLESMRQGLDRVRHQGFRLQSRLLQSEIRKGVKLENTENRAKSQRENAKRALIPMQCETCGIMLKRNKSVKHAYCLECLPAHKSQYQRDYNDRNVERLRIYWRKYDAERRSKLKVGR